MPYKRPSIPNLLQRESPPARVIPLPHAVNALGGNSPAAALRAGGVRQTRTLPAPAPPERIKSLRRPMSVLSQNLLRQATRAMPNTLPPAPHSRGARLGKPVATTLRHTGRRMDKQIGRLVTHTARGPQEAPPPPGYSKARDMAPIAARLRPIGTRATPPMGGEGPSQILPDRKLPVPLPAAPQVAYQQAAPVPLPQLPIGERQRRTMKAAEYPSRSLSSRDPEHVEALLTRSLRSLAREI